MQLPSKTFMAVTSGTLLLAGGLVIGLVSGGSASFIEYNAQKYRELERRSSISSFVGDIQNEAKNAPWANVQNVASPGGTLPTAPTSSTSSSSAGSDPRPILVPTASEDTLTGQFQAFISQQENLNEAVVRQEDRQKLVRAFIEQSSVREEIMAYTPYTKDDLTVTDESGTDVLRDYVNNVNRAFNENIDGDQKDEYALFQRAKNTSAEALQKELLSEIKIVQDRYDAINRELVSFPVPEEVAGYHLGMVNGISMIRERIEGMLALPDDPVRAEVNAIAYRQQKEVFTRSYQELTKHLKKQGVSFTQDKPSNERV